MAALIEVSPASSFSSAARTQPPSTAVMPSTHSAAAIPSATPGPSRKLFLLFCVFGISSWTAINGTCFLSALGTVNALILLICFFAFVWCKAFSCSRRN